MKWSITILTTFSKKKKIGKYWNAHELFTVTNMSIDI